MTKKLVKTTQENSQSHKADWEEYSPGHFRDSEIKVQKSAVFEVTRHIKKVQQAAKPVNSTVFKFESIDEEQIISVNRQEFIPHNIESNFANLP